MTTPLSQEQRAELVAKAKAATPGPWRIVPYDCGDIDYLDNAPMVAAAPELDCAIVHWEGFVQRYWRSARGEKEIQANAAFIAAANPSTILSYEATVQALTVERDAALERVKALEAGGVVSLADARRAVDACGGTHPPGQEEYGKGYDAALTEADAALVRLGRECVR